MKVAIMALKVYKSHTPCLCFHSASSESSTGLQIADLVSHPIGRHHLNPAQPNRAYEVIATKLCGFSRGEEKDRGLKIFP
jgi:hypothetical protein